MTLLFSKNCCAYFIKQNLEILGYFSLQYLAMLVNYLFVVGDEFRSSNIWRHREHQQQRRR